MEVCQNCEKPMGNLERTFEWGGHTVCRDCFELLRCPEAPAAKKEAPPDPALIMTCPHCQARVTPEPRRVGSDGMLIFLFLVGIIPGVLYAIFVYSLRYYCPFCRNQVEPSPELRRAVLLNQRRQARLAAAR